MNKKPNIKQEQAIFLMLSGKNISDVAKEIDVERATLYNWLKDKEFKKEYYSARKLLNEENINSLMHLNQSAIKTIKELLESPNEMVKLKAVIYLLDNLFTTDAIQQKEQQNFNSNFHFGFNGFE